MTTASIGAWLMLVFGGLWTGGIWFVAVERTSLWRRMPVHHYAVDFRRSLRRVDPMMPILGLITVAGSVPFALEHQGNPATLAWIGTALVGIVIVASVAIAEPINAQFRRIPEGAVPDQAEHLRATWRHFHIGRTVVALAALSFLAAGAVA